MLVVESTTEFVLLDSNKFLEKREAKNETRVQFGSTWQDIGERVGVCYGGDRTRACIGLWMMDSGGHR
jgi:hypothetical protein